MIDPPAVLMVWRLGQMMASLMGKDVISKLYCQLVMVTVIRSLRLQVTPKQEKKRRKEKYRQDKKIVGCQQILLSRYTNSRKINKYYSSDFRNKYCDGNVDNNSNKGVISHYGIFCKKNYHQTPMFNIISKEKNHLPAIISFLVFML